MGFDFQKEFFSGENSNMSIWREYFSDDEDLDYHVEFFTAGITAMIRKWLRDGCPGEPEHMGKILAEEYQKKNTI